MLTEKDFLMEIINLSPQGAVWRISQDSWEGIPKIFGQEITLSSDTEWVVVITLDNKALLLSLVDEYELPDKIVQMSISSADGYLFFNGDDHMDTVIFDFEYGNFGHLRNKYSELGIIPKEFLL